MDFVGFCLRLKLGPQDVHEGCMRGYWGMELWGDGGDDDWVSECRGKILVLLGCGGDGMVRKRRRSRSSC